MAVAITMIIYLQWWRPLDSEFANRMEKMNEVTLLLLAYILFCFSDFVPDADMRANLGFWYIGTSLANIAIHLLFMGYALYKGL